MRKTGKELWRKNAIDFKTGYSMTVAPLVADGVVITGISGAEFGTRDFIDGWDPKTGEHLWRTYTVPGPGEPGNETWQGDTWKLGGGSTWITGSFDPELHTVYWGIGNPGPFNAAVRPGDNLYTCSVMALDPKSGKIKWHFQFSPNNPFDYDSVAEMVLATLNIDGKPTPGADGRQPQRLLLRARSHQRQTLGRQSVREGELGVRHRHEDRPADRDRHHRPRRAPARRWWCGPRSSAARTGSRCRSIRRTALAYANTLNIGGRYKALPAEYKAGEWYVGMDLSDPWEWPDGPRGYLKAIDPLTGKTKWEDASDIPRFSGVLSTGGGLVFSGRLTGEFEAFDADTGKKLWQFQTGSGIEGQPVTWEQDGVQYVAIASGYGGVYSLFSGDPRLASVPAGGSLWVFALAPQ